MLIQTFDNIGKYGPGLIFIISIYLLYKNFILVTTYTIGYVLNILFNFLLKGIFQLPRPNENMKKIEAEMRLNKYITLNRFGMPSGHAHTSQNWIALMVVLSIITLAQRVHFLWHSLAQIFVGSIIGALVGYGFFYYSQIRIRGSLAMKEEQWAPF
jgi:membrane-associated phospholipid phosphatase